jgi:penicillin amidase
MKSNNFIKSHPILIRLSAAFLIPIVLVVVYVWLYLHSTLPKSEGHIVVSSINDDVEVIRDDWGVPHIFAETDNDAFFALGYLHAQDRLWQLEMQRRIAAGRLSEVLGRDTLLLDQFMRTLGIYYAAEQSLDSLSVESKSTLDAYVLGVNAWLNEGNALPPEFEIVGFKPEPWKASDSLVMLNLLALNLSGNWREEINRLLLSQELTENKTADLFPAYPDDAPSTITNYVKIDKSVLNSLKDVLSSVETKLGIGAKGVGSNAWVVSGRHTKSGLPFLASDPHLGAQIPTSFYVAEIQGNKIHVAGASLPGLPFIIVGHNENISWGATNMMADTQDLYEERQSTEKPDMYEFNGEMVTMDIRSETIYVKPDFPSFLREPIVPVKWKVRSTKRGPVISDVTDHLEQPMSLQWTALNAENTTYESYLKFNYANDWKSFKTSFERYIAPALNFVYADNQGNIGYIGAGKIPVRTIGNGSTPVPGWTDEFRWNGFIPFEEQPETYNPESGYVITANNRVVGSEYPYHITVDWVPPFRAQRIESLLTQKQTLGHKFTTQDMAEIQGDQMSLIAEKLVPILIKTEPKTERQAEAIQYLKDWDYMTSMDSIASSIFHSWVRNLQFIILRDDFRGDMLNMSRSYYLYNTIENTSPLFMLNVLENEDDDWCNQIHTEVVESCAEIIAIALDKSIKELDKLLGDDVTDWVWGDAHSIKYPHYPFNNSKILDLLFDRVIANGGGKQTVNIGPSIYSVSEGYQQQIVAAFRAVIDLADMNNTQYILSTGQSGNIYNTHYDDMVEPHRDLSYNTLTFGRKNAVGKSLILSKKVLEKAK